MPRAFGFLGKGGVGKTTLSLALGRVLARKAPTLVVSLDPAHNLGDLAGMALADEPREVAPGLFLQEVDLEKRLQGVQDEIRRLIRSRFPRLLYLAEPLKEGVGFPGDEEEALLSAMLEAVKREVAYVVLDMPPTGMALRLLRWADQRKAWLSALLAWRKDLARRRARVARLWGKAPDDPVLSRLEALHAREEERRSRLATIRWWVVETPAPLAREEARRIRAFLEHHRWNLAGVVENMSPAGVPPSPDPLKAAEAFWKRQNV